MLGMEDIVGRLQFWSLLFVRLGACLFSMPLFGGRSVPTAVKAGILVGLTWSLLPWVRVEGSHLPQGLWGWAMALVREGIVGFALGWMVHLCLAAVPIAGQMIGFQMGFGVANVVDPMGQQQMSVIAQFLYLLALWLFFSLNGHHILILGILRSLEAVPLGAGLIPFDGIRTAVEGGTYMFYSALLLAAPLMLILLFIQVALGVVARTVPQMNVFFVGLPLQIGMGFLGLAAALSFLGPWLTRSMGWLHGAVALATR